MKYYFLTLFGIFFLSGCTSNWKHANNETGNMYQLKRGKVYQTVKELYMYKKTMRMLNTEIPSHRSPQDYIVIPAGSTLKLVRVERFGSYNNGYYHSVYATIIHPQGYAGRELEIDSLLSDGYKKPLGNKYLIESN